MGIENPVHLLFIAIVALVVLGPKRLPELAQTLGRGIREFREAIGQGGSHPLDPGPQHVVASEQAQPVPGEGAELPAIGPGPSLPSPDAPDRRPL